uniref:DUF4220 domain-containing protein n=1 Tax=Leersia perrieri TaxID=77586 RepID=A0A0D9W237_9ORYZ
MMPRWMNGVMLFLNTCSIQVLIVISFVSHLVLVLFAGVRRHKASGWRRLLLWLANQGASWAPTTALSKLSSVGCTAQQEQLVTLWVAFMLLHAAKPDNITAYALEDSVLSWRKKVDVLLQLAGPVSPLCILYKNFCNGDTMLRISSIICIMSIAKYLEGSYFALWRGNLEKIRSSMKEKKSSTPKRRRSLHGVQCDCGGRKHDDEQTLLVAHDLLSITKDALIDYLPDENDDAEEEEALSGTWNETDTLYDVVNIELSLMYDILYTKAPMVHTWGGYLMRIASPFAGATAFVLFWFHSKECLAPVDVIITYVLLASTVILDIKWLLRAVASTWTYSFLRDRPRSWLHHALLCSGKWLMLRGFIIYLKLFCFLADEEPTSYRMWSGIIGQFNLFQECTCDENEKTSNYVSSVLKCIAPDNIWMEYEYHYLRGNHFSGHVREKLFDRVWKNMELAFPERNQRIQDETGSPVCMKAIEGLRPPGFDQEINDALDFTPDLQETILILHIATNIFLSCAESRQIDTSEWGKAIKELSDYLTFLVAVRPSMLPGLALSSRYEAVLDALRTQWKKNNKNASSSCCCSNSDTRQKCLADILLYDWYQGNKNASSSCCSNSEKKTGRTPQRTYKWYQGNKTEILAPGAYLSVLYDSSHILLDGARLANLLLCWKPGFTIETDEDDVFGDRLRRQFPDLMKSGETTEEYEMPMEVTDIIFREWVRLLINVSIRCARDSHAKQLGRGGELTTIVWILAEHARKFRVKKTTQNEPDSCDDSDSPDIPAYSACLLSEIYCVSD